MFYIPFIIFLQILDSACNTWRDACYFHNVNIRTCEDITLIQWIKSGISRLKCYKKFYMLFELVTCLFYRAFLVLILKKIVKIIFVNKYLNSVKSGDRDVQNERHKLYTNILIVKWIIQISSQWLAYYINAWRTYLIIYVRGVTKLKQINYESDWCQKINIFIVLRMSCYMLWLQQSH